MAGLPHITVLMGTRNGAPYLRQQLASLAAQDHANWSLWVSDDGSTDATRSVLRAFGDAQPNPVMILPGPQRGLTANYLNLLCHPDLAAGPVAFADQDDLWLPTHLTRGLTAMAHRAQTVGQAYVPHRLIQRDDHVPAFLPWRSGGMPGFRNALVENLLIGSGLMLDAPAVALARRIGPVEVPFWDWWLYLITTGAGAQILRDPAPGVIYRAHAGNAMGPRHGIRAKLWRLEQLRNGTYRTWISENLAALEPHMIHLTPEACAILAPLLPMPAGPRLRRLSLHRHWVQDRVALWLAA